jgi:hypothetical protein
MQSLQPRAEHGGGIEPEFAGEFAVARLERRHAGRRIRTVGDRLQGVGHPRQRRHHHQHPRVRMRGRVPGGEPADGVPAMPLRDRGAAEFEHRPARGLRGAGRGGTGGRGHGGP